MTVVVCVVSCSSLGHWGYGAKQQTKAEFVQYVENVFRLQNRMTSELMALSGDDGLKPDEDLLRAEQQMQTKCVHLNDYVSRDIDGLSTSLWLRKHVELSALDCENAAHAVELLLQNALK